jgi:transcription-repair coupling factor (superfamily II helicase)
MTLRFTKAWSDQIDGVKLFETVSKISPQLQLKYTGGQIELHLPKTDDDWLFIATAVLQAAATIPPRNPHAH